MELVLRVTRSGPTWVIPYGTASTGPEAPEQRVGSNQRLCSNNSFKSRSLIVIEETRQKGLQNNIGPMLRFLLAFFACVSCYFLRAESNCYHQQRKEKRATAVSC